MAEDRIVLSLKCDPHRATSALWLVNSGCKISAFSDTSLCTKIHSLCFIHNLLWIKWVNEKLISKVNMHKMSFGLIWKCWTISKYFEPTV